MEKDLISSILFVIFFIPLGGSISRILFMLYFFIPLSDLIPSSLFMLYFSYFLIIL